MEKKVYRIHFEDKGQDLVSIEVVVKEDRGVIRRCTLPTMNRYYKNFCVDLDTMKVKGHLGILDSRKDHVVTFQYPIVKIDELED